LKVLVTGAAGFIGSHLCDSLVKDGFQVIGIDRLPLSEARNLKESFESTNFVYIEHDISNVNGMDKLFMGVEVVFHLAALADIVPSIESPETYFSSNVIGTFNVIDFSRLSGVRRIIYTASASCYGLPKEVPTSENCSIDPQYPYALTKYLGEELLIHWGKVYGLSVISLRLFNVFGPRSRTNGTYGAVFGVFLAQKLAGKPLTIVGDGTQTRDFIYVSDVVSALRRSINSSYVGILNIGAGKAQSVNYLAKLIGGEIVNIPKRPGEPDSTIANIEKVTTILGWKPKVTFEEGVLRVLSEIEYWRKAPIWTPETIAEATKLWFQSLGKGSEFWQK